METLILFNGVWVLLTTGETLDQVQNYLEKADIVVSVYPLSSKLIATRSDIDRYLGRWTPGTEEPTGRTPIPGIDTAI